MPKISIIVPVYNVEDYFEGMMDSLRNQTLSDIEIIVVEDCSTDNSKMFVEKVTSEDSRIIPIYHDENKGTSKSRKDGVAKATGEFVMFLDSDDGLENNACEILYNQIKNKGVDVLQFGTIIHPCLDYSKKTIENLEDLLEPCNNKIVDDNLINACFRDKLFGFTLWNKIYKSSICKKAFSKVNDKHLTRAEDLYASFLIMYYAKSYESVPNKFHNYYFGRGITGEQNYDIKYFKKLNLQGEIFDYIRHFLEDNNVFDKYKLAYDNIYCQIMEGCIAVWKNLLDKKNSPEGFDALISCWDSQKVISYMAKKYWGKYDEIANMLNGSECLKSDERKIKTIGVYYHRLYNGGVERLISLLATIWDDMGYNLVIFLDEISGKEYALPPNVKLVAINNWKEYRKDKYENRLSQWLEFCAEFEIELMVYNAWYSRSLLWDMIAIKSCGVKFLVHTQSVFTSALLLDGSYFAQMPYIYALTDGVVTMSRVDKYHWEQKCKNVFEVKNPPSMNLENIKRSDLNSHNILWIGRLSDEKNPKDAIEIMKRVVKQVPDAKLNIVGASDNGKVEKKLSNLIKKYSLNENIELCGHQANVEKYYENTSLVLLTSLYEGFSYTIAESKAYGIPYIGFTLPYLEFERDVRGRIIHPQGDIEGMAQSVVTLLSDDNLRHNLGKQAYDGFSDYASIDYKDMWSKIFSCLSNNNVAPKLSSTDDEYIETKEIYFDALLNQIKNVAKNNTKQNKKLKKKIEDIKKSKTYLVGRVFTYPFRLIKRMIK